MDDVIIRYVPLPPCVYGQTLLDHNGDYNVYINVNLSYEMQRKTLEHELEHIRNNDFEFDRPIAEAERELAR